MLAVTLASRHLSQKVNEQYKVPQISQNDNFYVRSACIAKMPRDVHPAWHKSWSAQERHYKGAT